MSTSKKKTSSAAELVPLPGKKVEQLPSNKQIDSNKTTKQEVNTYPSNPYRMPNDIDIFELRAKERHAKRTERTQQRKLKVHEKMTYTHKIKTRTRVVSKIDPFDEEEEKLPAVQDDVRFAADLHERKFCKETLNDYIAKKREMFRVQYAISVMHSEMRKLDEIAQAEERKLEMAEQYLEEDASTFDEFLKENDKNSVEAVKIAEQETKEKLEKVAEIKKINTTIMSLKSDISKSEDTLKEYKLYRKFLESISPKEWRDEIQKRRNSKRKLKLKVEKKTESRSGSGVMSKLLGTSRRQSRKVSRTITPKPTSDTESVASTVEDDSDSDEELKLYFTEPEQVLDIFGELEEQNLSLIQNSQETEVALEEVQQKSKETLKNFENEANLLQDQIEKLKIKIKQEQEKATDLETRVKMFASPGESKVEDRQAVLNELKKKVEQVYRGIIGSNEANIDTLQMLNNIENRLEELFDLVEAMPPDKVEIVKRAKEKERRLKSKEEKLKLLKQHQEERMKKSLERAKAAPKKITGKRLMFRSEPPQMKKKEDKKLDLASREEEELAYFFTE